MKNKNKIISILMCLSLALVPGCSQDNGGRAGCDPRRRLCGRKRGQHSHYYNCRRREPRGRSLRRNSGGGDGSGGNGFGRIVCLL